jgi:hypothetical protein
VAAFLTYSKKILYLAFKIYWGLTIIIFTLYLVLLLEKSFVRNIASDVYTIIFTDKCFRKHSIDVEFDLEG